MQTLTDPDIRPALKHILLQEFAGTNTIVIDEMPICWGDARVDIAVVNCSLHGYEIKSDRDTVDRLPRQIELYGKIFDTMTLVCSHKLLSKAMPLLPEWWGIQVPYPDNNAVEGVRLEIKRKPGINRDVNIRSVVELLWKEESISILDQFGLARGYRSRPRWDMWDRMIETIEVLALKHAVRERLKERKGWRPPETLQRLYADSHHSSPS